jgi:hypothetical protein
MHVAMAAVIATDGVRKQAKRCPNEKAARSRGSYIQSSP